MQVDRTSGYSNVVSKGSIVTISDDLISDKDSERITQFVDTVLFERFKKIIKLENPNPADAVFADHVFGKYFADLKQEKKIVFDLDIRRIVVKDPNAILRMAREIFGSIKSKAFLNITEVIFSRSTLNDQVIKKTMSNNMTDWKIICFYGFDEKNNPLLNFDRQTKEFIRFNLPS